MKRALILMVLVLALCSTFFHAIPASAASIPAPKINSATLKSVGDNCELSVTWANVSQANMGYQLNIYNSKNVLTKALTPKKGSTSAKLTVTNDNYTIKIRSVNKSWLVITSYSSYTTAKINMVNPVITTDFNYAVIKPNTARTILIQTRPKTPISVSLSNANVEYGINSGVSFFSAKKHGETVITIKSAATQKTIRIYVPFTTEAVQKICSEKGYATGTYWSYSLSKGSPTAYTASMYKATTETATSKGRPGYGDYVGYSFDNARECMGFAHYIGYRISGFHPWSDWVKFISKDAVIAEGGLQVGDIVRANGHSAVVYSAANSIVTFAEAWGGTNNIIKINAPFGGITNCTTLEAIPNFAYVYRCKK